MSIKKTDLDVTQVLDGGAQRFYHNVGNGNLASTGMSVETDGKERITKILSFRQLKLAKCRADKALKFPG